MLGELPGYESTHTGELRRIRCGPVMIGSLDAAIRPLTSRPDDLTMIYLLLCSSRNRLSTENSHEISGVRGECAGRVADRRLGHGTGGAQSDEKMPSIKKVMDKLHKGKNAPLNTVKAALKSDSPDWADVQKDAKVFATYGAYLPKNDPPKGSKESWEKLAKAYASNGKALEDRSRKGRLKAARSASTKMLGTHARHAMPHTERTEDSAASSTAVVAPW